MPKKLSADVDAEVYLRTLSDSVTPFVNSKPCGDSEVTQGQEKCARWVQQLVTVTFAKLSLNQLDDAIICAMDAARIYEALRYLPLLKESHTDKSKWWPNSKAAIHYIQQMETPVKEKSARSIINRACEKGRIRSMGKGLSRRIDPYTLELLIMETRYRKNNPCG
jgi:hypothetical protein